MKYRNRTVLTYFVFLIILVSLFTGGCLEQSSGLSGENGTEKGAVNNSGSSPTSNHGFSAGYGSSQSSHLKTEEVNLTGSEAGNFSLARNYRLEALDLELKTPQYELPLKESDLSNCKTFSHLFSANTAALEKLEKNGFVVVPNPYNPKEEDIATMYEKLKEDDKPIFITSDTVLHLYHVQFDGSMSEIERKELYDLLWEIDSSLLNASVEDYETGSGEAKEAARRNAAYFAVALSLLQPREEQMKEIKEFYDPEEGTYFDPASKKKYQFEIPAFVDKDVKAEMALIEAHKGFSISPIFLYNEDYSQYMPRGHYNHSEILKNYFKAFMWHGRMSMLLTGKLIEAEDPEKEARIQTIQACLITSRLKADSALLKKWDRIYAITAFYVGVSDDLGPYEYMEAMEKVFHNGSRDFNVTAIGNLKVELARHRNPEIYGGTGSGNYPAVSTAEQADKLLEDTKGFRFMGQRFIPDSYFFSKLTGPYTNEYTGNQGQKPFTFVSSPSGNDRGFPRGLDVMALLGSKRAVYWLDQLNDSSFENYSAQYNKLDSEFSNLSVANWNKNLYWSWLYSLRPLMTKYGNGYPTFMQTDAWQDKELSTSMASWTELRHDTILYSKQLYAVPTSLPIFGNKSVGYVEPVPEFYIRLLALTRMTAGGLKGMGALDEGTGSKFENTEQVLTRLIEISKKELENQELTEDDKLFIYEFGEHLEAGGDENKDSKKTSLIADIYTNQDISTVLEEGTGYVNMIIVAYKLPDGRILIGAGPVMSHYEFKQPMQDRLTDEKWREMLEANPPKGPEWTFTYIS
jgi:hypothetical protein